MSTINQAKDGRRKYRHMGCVYLLNDDDRTVWIVKGPRIGRRKRYRIPDSVMIEGLRYTIESVEIGAFRKAKCLKHLIVPDSIGFIDEYNFSNMPCLRSIYIGKGMRYISSGIFQLNRKLRNFDISKDNENICIEKGIIYSVNGECAFASPFKPRHLVVKEGVRIIDSVAFWWNERLEDIILPSTLKTLGDNSLAGCPKLKKVIFPEGFNHCWTQCLEDNPGLEYVDLPSTMETLETEAFYNCPNLKTLIIRCQELLVPTTGFDNRPFDCGTDTTLYVPAHLVEQYRKHPVWANIKCVEALDS